MEKVKANEEIKSSKGRLIAYWIITGLISLVLLNGGINDVFKNAPYYTILLKMGYPGYFSIILGVWKVLGVVAILIPRFPLLKEWAYAGFVFLLSGAIISHLTIGDNIIFQIITLILVVLSWYFRPASRKVKIQSKPI